MSERQLLLAWNSHEIIKGQAEFLQEDNPSMTEEEAWELAGTNQDLFTFEWEYVTEALTDIMEERGLDEGIYVESHNFGWRSLDGYAILYPENGLELLRKVLPKCDCTFYIYEDGEHGLAINNFHHDSPIGREWYYLRPATEEEIEELY